MLVVAIVPRCFTEKNPQPDLAACSQRLRSGAFFPSGGVFRGDRWFLMLMVRRIRCHEPLLKDRVNRW
jgi:hypothetical protein